MKPEKPIVKLLTWWTSRIEFDRDDYIDNGIWETTGVDEKEDKRIYTLRCIMNQNKDKIGKEIKMNEVFIIEFCYLLTVERVRLESIIEK